jgi:hypothetical protein
VAVNIPDQPTHKPKGNKRRWPRVTLASLGALATVATFVLQFVLPQLSSVNSKPSPISSPQSSTVAEARSTPETKTGSAQGECLDATAAIAACDQAHAAEIISSDGSCDLPALVEYAGGIIHTDTLRRDLLPTSVDSIDCTVAVPSGLTAKIRDGLLDRDHAVLRLCWDRFSERDVSCDQSHTAEVVYSEADLGTEQADCRTHAEVYTANALSRYESKLEILTRNLGNTVSCLIQVKGSNELRGSLKHLGTRALPISPRG